MNKNFPDPPSEGLFIKEGRTHVYLPFSSIMYAKAEGNYMTLYLYHQKDRISRMTLTELLSQLPSAKFIRVHKSYFVHTDYITEIHSNLLFIGQKQIPIGRNYKKNVEDYLKKVTTTRSGKL